MEEILDEYNGPADIKETMRTQMEYIRGTTRAKILFDEGVDEVEKENHEGALEKLEKAKEACPESQPELYEQIVGLIANVMGRLGNALSIKCDDKTAREWFHKEYELRKAQLDEEGKADPDELMRINLDYLMKKAKSYFRVGRYDKCLAEVGEVLKQDPYHTEALNYNIVCLCSDPDFDCNSLKDQDWEQKIIGAREASNKGEVFSNISRLVYVCSQQDFSIPLPLLKAYPEMYKDADQSLKSDILKILADD